MTMNVGKLDRALRIVIGLALIGATIMGLLPVWGWIGLVPLVTGLVGNCPVYTLLGIKTGSGGCCCSGTCEGPKDAPK